MIMMIITMIIIMMIIVIIRMRIILSQPPQPFLSGRRVEAEEERADFRPGGFAWERFGRSRAPCAAQK